MASSFSSQIPSIVHLFLNLSPKSVLDIGKGFVKYVFLILEYIGIDDQKRFNPELTMAQQSKVHIYAIEVDKDLLLPHLSQVYNEVFADNVFEIYKILPQYDLILMIDVIEHLDKENAIAMLKYFLSKNSIILIATPVSFFKQELYQSEFEHHISHWKPGDFKKIGYVDLQYLDGGAIYLLSKEKMDVRGFGNSMVKKLRRIARAVRNEI